MIRTFKITARDVFRCKKRVNTMGKNWVWNSVKLRRKRFYKNETYVCHTSIRWSEEYLKSYHKQIGPFSKLNKVNEI